MICSALLTLSVFVYNLLDAFRLPDPPVFTGVQHYPCNCYLPPDSGLCSTEETQDTTDDVVERKDKLPVAYYFDSVTEECYPFGVQNCGGNANRFESLNDCQNHCKKRK